MIKRQLQPIFKWLALIIALMGTWAVLADTEGQFSVEKLVRLNTPSNVNNFEEWANFQLIGEGKYHHLNLYGEGVLRVYLNSENDRNYSVPELFAEYKATRNQLSVGRRIVDWSPELKFWQLGALNARQSFELLGQKEEGLTGLHYGRNLDEHFKFGLFFSYVFVPQLNPSLKIKDGEVSSTSEWVRLPPKRVKIEEDVVRPVTYEINRPQVEKVIFKKSLGAMLSYEDKRQIYRIYGIYKPENTLRVNASADIERDSSMIYVTANPIVNHHLMFGLSGEWRLNRNLELAGGADYIDPNAKLGADFDIVDPVKLREDKRYFETEGFRIDPSYDKEAYIHGRLTYKEAVWETSLRYIFITSDNQRASDDFYSDTVKWKRTLAISGQYSVTDNLYLLGDYRYDLARRDQILKGEILYKLSVESRIRIGIEMLRSPKDNSYWSAYRANDAAYTSFQYLF